MPTTKTYPKIVINGEVKIDLTGDDVTSASLLSGVKAHDKTGAEITGSCEYNADTSGDDVTAATMLYGTTAHNSDGDEVTGTMPNVGKQTNTIDTKDGIVTILRGFHDGTGSVVLAPSAVSNLIASNIRAGKSILGITGTMSATEGLQAQQKSVTPTFAEQSVTYDSPTYNALSKVTVAPIPVSETPITGGGYCLTVG